MTARTFDHRATWAELDPIDRWLLCFVAWQAARERPAIVHYPKAWAWLVGGELVDVRQTKAGRVATLTARGTKLHALATRDVLEDTEEWTHAESADPAVLPDEPAILPKRKARATRPRATSEVATDG